MNARIETIAVIGGTRAERRPEAVDLHPAQGIIGAIVLSLILWAAGFVLLLVA